MTYREQLLINTIKKLYLVSEILLETIVDNCCELSDDSIDDIALVKRLVKEAGYETEMFNEMDNVRYEAFELTENVN